MFVDMVNVGGCNFLMKYLRQLRGQVENDPTTAVDRKYLLQ